VTPLAVTCWDWYIDVQLAVLPFDGTFAFPGRRSGPFVGGVVTSSTAAFLAVTSKVPSPDRRAVVWNFLVTCSFVASFGHFAAQSLDNSPSNPFLLHTNINHAIHQCTVYFHCACASLIVLYYCVYLFDEHSRTTQYILATNFTLRPSIPWPQFIPVRSYVRMRVTSVICFIIILRYYLEYTSWHIVF